MRLSGTVHVGHNYLILCNFFRLAGLSNTKRHQKYWPAPTILEVAVCRQLFLRPAQQFNLTA
jgi:hypothetical protein